MKCTIGIDYGTQSARAILVNIETGEVLDVDAFTGGFNMQIAFSTGFAAGDSIKD